MEYDALDANLFSTDTCLNIYPYSSATLASPKVLQHLYPVKQSPAAQTLFQHILEISFLTLLRQSYLHTHLPTNQCDQIGRFIGLWATFQSLWQQLICPNLSHSKAIFVSKAIIFIEKSFWGNFYRHFAIFIWSHCV